MRVGATFANGKSSFGGSSEYDTYNGLNVSAYLQEADRTLTIVLLNMRSSNQAISIELPEALSITSFQVHLTSSRSSFARQQPLRISAGTVSLTVPAYAVLTLHAGTAAPR